MCLVPFPKFGPVGGTFLDHIRLCLDSILDRLVSPCISLDSSVMYLERDGAMLREMPVTIGPDRRVGSGSDTVHIAAPRGKRLVERLMDEGTVSELPSWVYGDRGIPPGETRLKGALGPAAIMLDGGTVI